MLNRLGSIGKFAIAVIHHDNDIRIAAACQLCHLFNLCKRKCRTQCVTSRTLNVSDFCTSNRFWDCIIIRCAIFQQWNFVISYAVIHQRTIALVSSQSNDTFQGIIRSACDGNHFIPCPQNTEQSNRQSVCSRNKIVPNQSIFCTECFCDNFI